MFPFVGNLVKIDQKFIKNPSNKSILTFLFGAKIQIRRFMEIHFSDSF